MRLIKDIEKYLIMGQTQNNNMLNGRHANKNNEKKKNNWIGIDKNPVGYWYRVSFTVLLILLFIRYLSIWRRGCIIIESEFCRSQFIPVQKNETWKIITVT